MLKKLQLNSQDPKNNFAIAPVLRDIPRPLRKRKARRTPKMDGKREAVPAISPASVFFVIELV